MLLLLIFVGLWLPNPSSVTMFDRNTMQKIEPNYILSILLFKMNNNLHVYDTPQTNPTERSNITHGLKLTNHNRITPTES